MSVNENYGRQCLIVASGVIDALCTVLESRSAEVGDHAARIKGYTRLLLEQVNGVYEMQLSAEEQEIACYASVLHDVGKIAIPDNILLKPGRFTREEFEIMKQHTLLGSKIIDSIHGHEDKRFLECCHTICRYHHERYDGKGYPDGLAGEDIPLVAQIVSLADVYEALTSKRSYRQSFSPEKAYEMIVGGECGAFSPNILSCLARAKSQMEEFAHQILV